MTASILDDIPNLGDKRKEIVFRAYPDITLLRSASLEELEQLLPEATAKALYMKIHQS